MHSGLRKLYAILYLKNARTMDELVKLPVSLVVETSVSADSVS